MANNAIELLNEPLGNETAYAAESSGRRIVLSNQATFGAAFTLACVWFSTHVGGGFATGNQAIQYFVQYGWVSVLLPFLAMLLLAFCMRTSIVMARTQNIYSYKDLFCYLWSPYPRIEISFEIFYYIIMIAAVGGAIAGAASLFVDLGLSYGLSVLLVGAILLGLTVFGAGLVAKAALVFTVGILAASFTMYFIGIEARAAGLTEAMTRLELPFGPWAPLWMALLYACFQGVSIPAVVACSGDMKTKKRINAFFVLGFILNGCALGISCWMLLAWQGDINAAVQSSSDGALMALPNLYVCKSIGYGWLYAFYFLSLFLAFISTGVTCIFALVTRLENSIFTGSEGFFSSLMARRVLISLLAMGVSMAVSMLGLTNIVYYGYGVCGYLSLFFVILPLLIIGPIKNRRFLKANPDFWEKLGQS